MRYIITIICSVFIGFIAYCQEETHNLQYDKTPLELQKISPKDLASFKKDTAFDYTEKKLDSSWFNKFSLWLKNSMLSILKSIFGAEKATEIFQILITVLIYLSFLILVYLLFRFFLNVNSKSLITNNTQVNTIQFTEEEELLQHKDLEKLLQTAVQQKNYRLAIRYYFLLSLQKLNEKKWITWEQQKTNADYIKELQSKPLKEAFSTIAKIYDYVWYGEFSVNQIQYEQLKKPFEKIKTL